LVLLNDTQKLALRNAQRLWIKYRDAICDFEGNMFKAEHWIEDVISNPKSLKCISRLSLTRTKELNKYSELLGDEPKGYVIISFIVDERGRAKDAKVEESTLEELHNRKAIMDVLISIYPKSVVDGVYINKRSKHRFGIEDFNRKLAKPVTIPH
jgi:hypothetical protein